MNELWRDSLVILIFLDCCVVIAKKAIFVLSKSRIVKKYGIAISMESQFLESAKITKNDNSTILN